MLIDIFHIEFLFSLPSISFIFYWFIQDFRVSNDAIELFQSKHIVSYHYFVSAESKNGI